MRRYEAKTLFVLDPSVGGFDGEDLLFTPGLDYVVATEELQIPDKYLEEVYLDADGRLVVMLREEAQEEYLWEDWYHALHTLAEEAA